MKALCPLLVQDFTISTELQRGFFCQRIPLEEAELQKADTKCSGGNKLADTSTITLDRLEDISQASI